MQHNIRSAEGLGLPSYREFKATSEHLAVVGGGPSIEAHKEEILGWKGDIWAINGTWRWLKDMGRDSVFLGVDPGDILATMVEGAEVALLDRQVDPEVFRRLSEAKVYVIDLGAGPGQVRSGSSAATVTPHLACRCGYHSVTLFGCESSYQPQYTHAYRHEERPDQLIVRCGQGEYLTAPDFYMQALELARYIKEIPEYLKERSGGLLRAMLQNDCQHSILWVSDALAQGLKPVEELETISS